MPQDFTRAGADAAGAYDDYFRRLVANDPDVQGVIQRVWGTTPVDQRPSDTPKHLEHANDAASKEITRILAGKGITLPGRTFVNPRSGALEGHRGWSGLNGWQKAAIIAAGAATGVGGLAAAGALGGGAAAGAGGIGATTGVPAGLGSVGATGVGLGGAAVGGSSPWLAAGVNAGVNAAKTKAQGGSWTDAALSGATGAATGGLGGQMSWTDLLTNPDTYSAIASIAGRAAGSKSDQRQVETSQTNQANLADLALYTAGQNAQNQAGQLDLNRKQFSENARGGRGKQALLADLISNMQDIAINVPGVQTASVTGGLRPSAIGQVGRDSMAAMGKQALEALLTGDTFTGGEILPTPEYRPMPQQGGMEKALDWIGLLGAGAGALGSLLPKNDQPGTYSQLPSAQGQPDPVLRNQRNVRF